ncbi:hypothetical protein K466DRAFT_568985 [Polyporus arcularius HHB13444]|uniref:Uncharacterized protein n=1 Tax=Polyporus arcularius HHB13444 TaxID=1314778 RepID=A0A5C3NVX9_9APHY|nr:hypothetical protein K466DRAFT_568985 [Polyporus arcularius HHB13444]
MTSTNAPPLAFLPTLPALDNTFGAYLLGTMLGMLQYGVLLHQGQEYFRLYPRDPRVLKGLAVTTPPHTSTSYYYLVTNYFKPQRLLVGVWSINLTPLASALTNVGAQSSHSSMLKGNRAFIDTVVRGEAVLEIQENNGEYRTTLQWSMRMTDPFWSSPVRSLLLVYFSLLTGTLHVLLWILLLTLHGSQSIKYPMNLIYAAIALVNTRLYGNVLLATLNARISFSRRGMHTFGVVSDLPDSSTAVHPGRYQSGDPTTTPRGVIELKPWKKSQHDLGTSGTNVSLDIDDSKVSRTLWPLREGMVKMSLYTRRSLLEVFRQVKKFVRLGFPAVRQL